MKLFVSAILMACVIALNGQPMKEEESKDVVSADSAAEYLFEKTPMTWGQADARCKRWGGRLVTVKDAAQNAYILRELRRRGMRQSWTGLNDRVHEGQFVWLYGQACSHYKNWHHGEPNGHRGENCMEFIPSWNGQWNDVSCNARRASVCHRVGGGNGCGGGHGHHGGQWVMTKEVVYYKDPVAPVSTETTTELSADEQAEGLDEKDVNDESNNAPEENAEDVPEEENDAPEENAEDVPEEESDAPEEDAVDVPEEDEEEEVEDEE